MSNADKGSTNRLKGFISSKRGEFIVLGLLAVLSVLFTVIYYSIPFTDYFSHYTERSEVSIWTAELFYLENPRMPTISNITGLNTYFVIAFVVLVVLYVGATALKLIKNNNLLFACTAGYNAALGVVTVIVGAILEILRGGAVFCCIVSIVFSLLLLVFAIWRHKARKAVAGDGNVSDGAVEDDPQLTPAGTKRYRLGVLICEWIALAVLAASFFIPLYSSDGATASSCIPITAISSSASLMVTIVFLLMLLAFFAELVCFAFAVSGYSRRNDRFVRQSRRLMTGAGVFVLLFFIFGFCIAFYNNVKSADDTQSYYTFGYIPFLLYAVTLIVYSVFYGKLCGDERAAAERKPVKIEPLIFSIAMTAVTFISLFFDIVKIKVSYGMTGSTSALSGYKLLADYKQLGGGYQVLAFAEAAVLLMSGMLLILSVISYFAKDRNFYKIVKIGAVANFLFVLFISLFGLYFKIAQKINEENIKNLLEYFKITVPDDAYQYEVTSQTIYMLIAGFAVMAAMLIRGIFGLGSTRVELDAESAGMLPNAPSGAPSAETAASDVSEQGETPDFDACPAFTDLDGQQARFIAETEERRAHLFANPTLPNLVRFVVDYARESRLHLSYSVEDIATFVAGLGASRLTILQGMSGTGKTSLPKIFAEAIMGNCEIVEVESSWRDKNELLGYYNEFSKCFTPKKFTQCLYKARLNSSVLTLIVLDEMNLSRIEYYFSDFLSLMENEEDKREIKLSNVKLFRYENGQKIPYDGLTDGHTVKIPANIWFIGTANRDESTFAISDKVYDRAQTMNFNKRAPKIYSFGEPLAQRFVPYDMLIRLFDAARADYAFDAENDAAIQKTEKLLAPYNISFGNRVLKQMEDFVKIYCACFGDKAAAERDAVERILLSKVVSKLETKVVENKEALASEFDKLGLRTCGAFVRKLSED